MMCFSLFLVSLLRLRLLLRHLLVRTGLGLGRLVEVRSLAVGEPLGRQAGIGGTTCETNLVPFFTQWRIVSVVSHKQVGAINI